MICCPEFSALHSNGALFLPSHLPKKKNNPQKSLGPYQQDTRKPNPTFKPDHLQMCFRPRFNTRRRFLGEASFWKSACQFLEALSCVSSVFSRFLSTHKVNVHREWTWTERLHQNLAVLWLPLPGGHKGKDGFNSRCVWWEERGLSHSRWVHGMGWGWRRSGVVVRVLLKSCPILFNDKKPKT